MTIRSSITVLILTAACICFAAGCDTNPTNPPSGGPSNPPSGYIGSAACAACHPNIAADHLAHGHANVLTQIQGLPPGFPAANPKAGVPDPPPGMTWSDIAYVVGGYNQRANFIDRQGFLITTGVDAVDAQWNLDFSLGGHPAGFVEYEPEQTTPKPYDFDCFRCHTTGPADVAANGGLRQGNLPGMGGTWAEDGVQCEACHGPGRNHVAAPSPQTIIVDTSAEACARCHARSPDQQEVQAADGFILNYQQAPELRASGGHADFDCTFCHMSHVSTKIDESKGQLNGCTACHSQQNLAFHEGIIFVRGDYVETVTCESCHMPFATRSGASATPDVNDDLARIGDVRTHIFRIETAANDFNFMFDNADDTVRMDAQGRAAVTVDFVCLRCHNGLGRAFPLTTQGARVIADGMHATAQGADAESSDAARQK